MQAAVQLQAPCGCVNSSTCPYQLIQTHWEENSFWLLAYSISFFLSLPKVHDHGLECRSTSKSLVLHSCYAPSSPCLSVKTSTLQSTLHWSTCEPHDPLYPFFKTLRYLNSTHLEQPLIPNTKVIFTGLWQSTMTLELRVLTLWHG